MSNRRRAQTRRQAQAAISTAVIGALIAGGIGTPAYAEKAPGAAISAVPDAGARPLPSGIGQLPAGPLGLPPTLPAVANLKLALQAQYDAAVVEQQVLAQRLTALKLEHERALTAKAMADYAWRLAADQQYIARKAAEQSAIAAYQATAKLPPNLTYGSLRDLDAIRRHTGETPTVSEAAAREFARAQQAERAAYATLTATTADEQRIRAALATDSAAFDRRVKALLELRRRVAALQSEEDRRAELEDQDLGSGNSGYDSGKSNAGLVAHAKARGAVAYALRQIGKPYQWGDEGPNSFDCSGLMWAAYRSMGISINRVANDQYYGTRHKTVSKSALLPGDLLFFATDPSDWRTIYHVGMYLGRDGNGVDRWVRAPTAGEDVNIARVNLAKVVFATRVIDAVPVTLPSPTPSKSKSPSPRPPASPSPSKSPQHSPPPSPTPKASPSVSPAAPPPDNPDGTGSPTPVAPVE